MTFRPHQEREHTELEEELHEKAHIDYDRVAIVCHKSTQDNKLFLLLMTPTDSQPFCCRIVRRCPSIRDGHRYLFFWSIDSILWKEDRSITLRQENRQGTQLRE